MNLAEITSIAAELKSELLSRRFGRIFRLSRFEIVIDLDLSGSRFLFISIEPGDPRCYLIKRRLRDIVNLSQAPTPFILLIQKYLSGLVVDSVSQILGERVLILAFSRSDLSSAGERRSLAIQLTGRSASLFLLDDRQFVIDSAREASGIGQSVGEPYSPPMRANAISQLKDLTPPGEITANSEFYDRYYSEIAEKRRFDALAASARKKLDQKISKIEKLAHKLDEDLAGHGDPEKWKRIGDLMLANISTAKRDGTVIRLIDYFDPELREIEIEADTNKTLSELAENNFKRYTKSRNARKEIAVRMRSVNAEVEKLLRQRSRLEEAISERDENLISDFSDKPKLTLKHKKAGNKGSVSAFARIFVSSDGFEILVGKKAKDNDYLTFRIARSLELWLHAADYPGSHVIIRNPDRKEIPQRTLLEAAGLAAFYSQGKSQTKAAVNYSLRKFVNKPKGSAPGLVRLASFKTILVEPRIVPRLRDE